MYKIYCYTNLINNKKYIGLTKRSLDAREVNHLSEAYNSNSPKYSTPFKQAIRKYGIKGFKREVLEEIATLEEANQREQYYIQKLNTYCYQGGCGYNATLGGDGVAKNNSNIVAAYKGRTKTAFGYVWRTYYDYIHNITPTPQKLKLYKKDEEGSILEEYETLRAMARANNMVEQTLGRHINKGLYKGYYWTKE